MKPRPVPTIGIRKIVFAETVKVGVVVKVAAVVPDCSKAKASKLAAVEAKVTLPPRIRLLCSTMPPDTLASRDKVPPRRWTVPEPNGPSASVALLAPRTNVPALRKVPPE